MSKIRPSRIALKYGFSEYDVEQVIIAMRSLNIDLGELLERARTKGKQPHSESPSDDPTGPQIRRRGRIIDIDLWYPRSSESYANTVQISLTDVRSADDIRVEFDFDRDGWVIKQEGTDAWREVAFAKCWQLEEQSPDEAKS